MLSHYSWLTICWLWLKVRVRTVRPLPEMLRDISVVSFKGSTIQTKPQAICKLGSFCCPLYIKGCTFVSAPTNLISTQYMTTEFYLFLGDFAGVVVDRPQASNKEHKSECGAARPMSQQKAPYAMLCKEVCPGVRKPRRVKMSAPKYPATRAGCMHFKHAGKKGGVAIML